jgi:protein-tyrosine phosphatase
MSVDPTRIDLTLDPQEKRMVGVAIHGNTPFDVPYVSQIAPDLWTGGCADGLILPRDIEHVVSLYPWERYDARHEVRSVLSVRMYDSLGQTFEQVNAIASWVNVCRRSGPVLVHCQAGLNRSALVAARALMLDGMTGAEAVALLREKRSSAVLCNPAFKSWLLSPERL